MNIKVAAFTVSEKSINIELDDMHQRQLIVVFTLQQDKQDPSSRTEIQWHMKLP